MRVRHRRHGLVAEQVGLSAERRPRLHLDAALLAPSKKRLLREVGMQLDLVDGRPFAIGVVKRGEVLGQEVGDTEPPDQALLARGHELAIDLAVAPKARQRPMDEVIVEVAKPEVVQTSLQARACARHLVIAPQLRGYRDLIACHSRISHAQSDLALIAVARGRIDEAVAELDRACHRGCRVRERIRPISDRRYNISIVSHTASLASRPAPRLVAFDLDDTLAPSKSPVPNDVARGLMELLERVPVCVISGGQFAQFETQLLPHLDLTEAASGRLHLMPTCGTRYLVADGSAYREVYARNLSEDQRHRAMAAVEATAKELGLWESETWGPAIEDRGSQITYSALGQAAPLEAKKAWDPSGEKKNRLRDELAPQLADLEVRSGGSTSVDITARGVDKAYGMRELAAATGIALTDMLFIGDRLDPHGNDYPVKALGVPCLEVSSWQETADVIAEVIIRLDESSTHDRLKA